MDPKDDNQDTVLFTSNYDILEKYEEIFQREDIDEMDFYLEKDFGLEEIDIFRFILTPNGLIAVSSSTEFPEDREDVWTLSAEDESVKVFLKALNSIVRTSKGNTHISQLQGAVPYADGYTYRIYPYNHYEDSREIKRLLDERRIGYLMNKDINDTFGK